MLVRSPTARNTKQLDKKDQVGIRFCKFEGLAMTQIDCKIDWFNWGYESFCFYKIIGDFTLITFLCTP